MAGSPPIPLPPHKFIKIAHAPTCLCACPSFYWFLFYFYSNMTQYFECELLWSCSHIQANGLHAVRCDETVGKGCTRPVVLYAAHCPLVTVYHSSWLVCAWIIGRSVAASCCCTISIIYPSDGELEVSTRPNTHTSLVVALPQWFYMVQRETFLTCLLKFHPSLLKFYPCISYAMHSYAAVYIM